MSNGITRRDLFDGMTLTIANSDAGWEACPHAAIDQAHRAVAEF